MMVVAVYVFPCFPAGAVADFVVCVLELPSNGCFGDIRWPLAEMPARLLAISTPLG
jgi:hypothetical protein